MIDNGAVLVVGNRIRSFGRWITLRKNSKGRVLDLGEVVLLPGLVNAHCHLDYTAMAGHLPPMNLFTDWLKLITELKAGWDYNDYAESWKDGAAMLLRTGTTTVGDIEAVPDLLPDMWKATPLRVLSFIEMIGITGRRSPKELLAAVCDKVRSLPRNDLHQAGLSPHAPYSTLPELLRRCTTLSSRRKWRICMHIAESELEYRMFTKGRGPMHAWMQRSGRDMSDCGKGSPVEHAAACRLMSDRMLAVHMNYLGRNDLPLLRESGAHVVHCPRSHEYFGHRRFPLKTLLKSGVNVCLGTDSLASVLKRRSEPVELSMFDEMRALRRTNRGVSAKLALRMSTISGARALGMAGKIGEIAERAFADLIAIPDTEDLRAEDAVLRHKGPVTASLINGAWALSPN